MGARKLAAVRIVRQPSPHLLRALAVVHGTMCVALTLALGAVLPSPALLALLSMPLTARWLAAIDGQALLRAPDSIVEAVLAGDGQWRLRTRSGQWHDARLLAGSLAHPLLICAALRGTGGERFDVVAVPGSIEPGAARAMRVQLRLLERR